MKEVNEITINVSNIDVPYNNSKGELINYISQWDNFELPKGHSVIDKSVCGCGFTHYCLTNKDFVILVSPRVSLLENKLGQIGGCYFFKSINLTLKDKRILIQDLINQLKLDKTSVYSSMTDDCLKDYITRSGLLEESINREVFRRQVENLKDYLVDLSVYPKKLMVTNDSLPKLLRALEMIYSDFSRINQYHVIVDEFQLIFTDSRFKASTELDLVINLQNFSNVTYVSATPMMLEYIGQVPEFSSIPFYRLNWGTRVFKPTITRVKSSALYNFALQEITAYKDGVFSHTRVNNLGQEVTSKEITFYVSNIGLITRIIKSAKLTPEEVNIMASDTPDNRRKLKQLGKGFEIGKAPLKGEPHKMFTFCTSTVYCGVDFYSTNTRSIILSDCNIDSMAIDISLDLPQILGRQRLIDENPFACEAIFVYTTTIGEIPEEEIHQYWQKKIKRTENLIGSYFEVSTEERRQALRDSQRLLIESENYSKDYTSVDSQTGDLVFNHLIYLSDKRAWEVQQQNYKNDFQIMKSMTSANIGICYEDTVESQVYSIMSKPQFEDRIRLCCEYYKKDPNHPVFNFLPKDYLKYLNEVGISGITAVSYSHSKLERVIKNESELENSRNLILEEIRNTYKPGDRISLRELKGFFGSVKEKFNLSFAPKANLIKDYCLVSDTMITDKVTKIRLQAFKIISINDK